MRFAGFVIYGMMLIPILLFVMEVFLCKRESMMAIILPVVIACFFILIGVYALFISAIMFVIYFVMRHIERMKEEKKSELDKMHIQDL